MRVLVIWQIFCRFDFSEVNICKCVRELDFQGKSEVLQQFVLYECGMSIGRLDVKEQQDC